MKQHQADFSLNRKQTGLLFFVIRIRYTKFVPRALSIQQKFRFEIWEISRANGTVHIRCTDPTQDTTHLVIVLVRIQKSGTGDNDFVKWKGAFRSDRPKWPDRSKWTTFKAGPEYSGRTNPKWSVPFDVPTEISGMLGWMESAPILCRTKFCRDFDGLSIILARYTRQSYRVSFFKWV